MAEILLPSQRIRQPQGNVRANPKWARGMAFLSMPYFGVDTFSGSGLPLTGTNAALGVGSNGAALIWNASTVLTYLKGNIPITGAASFVVLVRTDDSSYDDLIYTRNDAAAGGVDFRLDTGGKAAYVVPGSVDIAQDLVNPGLSSGQTGCVGLTITGQSNPNTYTFYKNGQKGSTGSTTTTATSVGGFQIGGASAAAYQGKKAIYIAAAWNRVLSNVEMQALTANPWQLFADSILPIPTSSGTLYPTLSNIRFNPATSTGGYVAVDLS